MNTIDLKSLIDLLISWNQVQWCIILNTYKGKSTEKRMKQRWYKMFFMCSFKVQ